MMSDDLLGISQRIPPSNLQAEQALLGALLSNNKCYDRITCGLNAEHFADPIHARIWRVTTEIIENGGLADAVTLKNRFSNDGILHEVGGTEYLTKLLTAMVGLINVNDYALAIVDTWKRREGIDIGHELVTTCFHPDFEQSADETLARAEARLSDISLQTSGGETPVSIMGAVDAAIAEAERNRRYDEAIAKWISEGSKGQPPTVDGLVAISTGLPLLDGAILKLRPQTEIVIGGRPSMGKTAIARTILLNVALGRGETADGEIIDNQDLGHAVAYFSLEESSTDFGSAAVSFLSNVPLATVIKGAWSDREAEKVVLARQRFAQAERNIHIYQKPKQSARLIQQQCRALQRRLKGRLRLVVIDYLQLMPNVKGLDKRLSVGHNVTELKGLAKEIDCAVIVVSQLSRGVEQRNDMRPTMGDLKETGEIEEAADVIILPYREAYYLAKNPPKQDRTQPPQAFQSAMNQWQADLDAIKNRADLIIPKVRRSRANLVIPAYFNDECVRFGGVSR